jgi:cytoskeletal protein RodZ
MATVAQQLLAAREARQLTVYQVADATKIKTEHVRALDEGNYRAFAAPVYIRGFVRTYAAFLKLEVPALMAELDRELAQTREFSEPPRLSGKPSGVVDLIMFQLSRINWQVALVVGGAILVIVVGTAGYRMWRKHQTANPLADLGPGLYESKPAPPSADLLPLPAPGQTKR